MLLAIGRVQPQALQHRPMNPSADDVYTEPSNIDFDTLVNPGPLRPMAGVGEERRGDRRVG